MNLENDSDIIAKLDTCESKQGYIKDLIRQDLACKKLGNTVSVPFSDAALSILTETAKKNGIPVPGLVSVIVNEQLMRTFHDGIDTAPVTNKHKTPEQLLAMLKPYTADYDGSMFELLNALQKAYMG